MFNFKVCIVIFFIVNIRALGPSPPSSKLLKYRIVFFSCDLLLLCIKVHCSLIFSVPGLMALLIGGYAKDSHAVYATVHKAFQ